MIHQRLSKKQLQAIHARTRKMPQIGDTVKTPLGIGKVQHIRSDYNTQMPESYKVKYQNTSPKTHSPSNVELIKRG